MMHHPGLQTPVRTAAPPARRARHRLAQLSGLPEVRFFRAIRYCHRRRSAYRRRHAPL